MQSEAEVNTTSENASDAEYTPPTNDAKVSNSVSDGVPVAQGSTEAPEVGKFIVDGKSVSEEEYFKAVEGTYDVARLRDMPYRPSISTKSHQPPKKAA